MTTFRVTTAVDPDDEGEEGYWAMTFHWRTSDGLEFSFEVQEPYMVSANAWRQLADGTGNVQLYQGNGEGAISVVGDDLIFVANPSGAGGDVIATLKMPRLAVAPALRDVVDSAERNGWKFSSFSAAFR